MKEIRITSEQKKTVLSILKKYFPKAKLFVFGSRATNRSLKPFSDLDIAVDDLKVISTDDIANANENFSSSDLPFKVDIIDLNSISTEFKKNIEPDLIELV